MSTKRIAIAVVILLIIAGGWWYWNTNNAATPDAALTSENELTGAHDEQFEVTAEMSPGVYQADRSQSSIVWEAGKPAISGYVHHGSFELSSGQVELTESALTGEFVVDMNSVKIQSLGGGKAGQESALEGHLKGSGFFDTATYPTATFTIIDVTPKVFPGPDQSDYTATGSLTMKGQTKSVTFPIKVLVVSETEVVMRATFALDRTEWGVSFGSAKIVEAITDNVIGDTVNLKINLRLQK